MVFFAFIITGILYHQIAITTSCATEPKKAEILVKALNNSFDFLCSSTCNGSYIFEHRNSSTGQYNVIREQPYDMYIATFNINQYSDGGMHRCRCNYTTIHCYLSVQVPPTMVKMNFAYATLNERYLGTCSAEGNPRPIIYANFNSSSCNCTITHHNISDFTGQVLFNISRVTEQCQNVTISCAVHQIKETTQLNVTSNHTSVNSTKDESPSHVPPTDDGGRGTSTTHNGSSMMMILTGIMTAIYWS